MSKPGAISSARGRPCFQWKHVLLATLGIILEKCNPVFASSNFIRMCYLQDQPVQSFTFDQVSKSFERYNPNSSSNGTSATGETAHIYEARECPCREGSYCLVDDGDACGVTPESYDVGCFHLSTKTIFVRNAWPVVVLWYAALVLFLITTDNGRHARNYVVAWLFPNRNRRLADLVVQAEVQLTERMRAAAMARHRRTFVNRGGRNEELEDQQNISSLVLKTRVYESPKKNSDCSNSSDEITPHPLSMHVKSVGIDEEEADQSPQTPQRRDIVKHFPETPTTVCSSFDIDFDEEDQGRTVSERSDDVKDDSGMSPIMNSDGHSGDTNETEDEITCTICLGSVEDGDRVGVLKCNHIFHSDCLKDWLRRRNVCPLCQAPDVAATRPRRRQQPQGDQQEVPSGEDPNPPSRGLSVIRVTGRSVPGQAQLDASSNFTAFRIRQPNGRVRIVYRMERPNQTRIRVFPLQEGSSVAARIFSAFSGFGRPAGNSASREGSPSSSPDAPPVRIDTRDTNGGAASGAESASERNRNDNISIGDEEEGRR